MANCVNRRYFAMRGMLTDVGGRIFDTRRRKTTRARRIENDQYQRTFGTETNGEERPVYIRWGTTQPEEHELE